MTYFMVSSIQPDGEIKDPHITVGQGNTLFTIKSVGLEKHHGNDMNYIVEVFYEHHMNNELLFDFKVTTTWRINGLDKVNIEIETKFLNHLLIRSVSHFHGVMSEQMRQKGYNIRLPQDPDFKWSIEFTKELMEKYSKS